MDIVIIRGGGDVATGIAHSLFMSGFNVVILEIKNPLSVRRAVSFSEAIYEKEVIVEGVKAVHVKGIGGIYNSINKGEIPVFVDEAGECIKILKPIAVVDSILAKKNLGTTREMAPITIGVGPGFETGVDVDLVVESIRGHNLGKVLYEGSAQVDTGIPGTIMGYSEERVIRALKDGIISNIYKIGDYVEKDTPICKIGDEYICAGISGIVRGLIKDGLSVSKGLKIGDIDPRSMRINAFTISDKARSIGGGVLEALLYLRKEEK